jgi:hypothetical protein
MNVPYFRRIKISAEFSLTKTDEHGIVCAKIKVGYELRNGCLFYFLINSLIKKRCSIRKILHDRREAFGHARVSLENLSDDLVRLRTAVARRWPFRNCIVERLREPRKTAGNLDCISINNNQNRCSVTKCN